MAIIKISDGNAFKLRVTAMVNSMPADLNVVTNMIVNFVRRGRLAQPHGIDSNGKLVISNDGSLARGIYGVEITGYHDGKPWRHYIKDAFKIVDENEDADTPSAVDDVPIYDLSDNMSFGGDGVTAEYVNSAISAHDSDDDAHPDLQQMIAQAGSIDDVQVNGHTVVQGKVANITIPNNIATTDDVESLRDEMEEGLADAGKVNDVEVNGQTVLDPVTKKASITVPKKVSELQNDSQYQTASDVDAKVAAAAVNEVNVSVDNTAPTGQPSAEKTFQGGVLDITFKNVKGEKGEEGKQGIQGRQGVPGESAVFDPESGNISTLVHVTGDSIVNPMSQKGVTLEVERLDRRFDGVDDDIYRNSKVVDDQTIYEDNYYKNGTPYTSAIAISQMTAPSEERVAFNMVKIGPVKRTQGTGTDKIRYRVCILASGDTLKVASGGTTIAEDEFSLTTSFESYVVNLPDDVILGVGEKVAVTIFRLGAGTPKIQLASSKTSTLEKFNDQTQKVYYEPYTSGSSSTVIADMEAAAARAFTYGENASSSNTYFGASPILRLVKQSNLDKALQQRIQTDIPPMVESKVEEKIDEAKDGIVEEATGAAVEAAIEAIGQASVKIWLPEHLYAVYGDKLELFYRGIVQAPNPYNYDIVTRCDVGVSLPRYYWFKADEDHPEYGDHQLSVTVYDKDGNMLGTKSSTLHVVPKPTSPAEQTDIFLLGASAVFAGMDKSIQDSYIAYELRRRLTASSGTTPNGIAGDGLSNISVYATGIGGWSFRSYISPAEKMFRVGVTGVTGFNQGSKYLNTNGYTYKVEEVNIQENNNVIEGYVLLSQPTGTKTTPLVGSTFTKSSGGGDVSFVAQSVQVEDSNPLWDRTNNKFTFKNWVTEKSGGEIKVLYVMLNFNGNEPWKEFSLDDVNDHIAYCKTFLDTFHSQDEYPNAKVRILTCYMPSPQGGMGYSYKADGWSDWYGICKMAWNLNKAYQELVKLPEYSSFVDIVDISSQFDSEYNYPLSYRAVNRRRQTSSSNTAIESNPDIPALYTEYLHSNGVHPSTAGYYQLADAIYRSFVAEFGQPNNG